jgi:Ca2+-binding EF-hand superfamily protein
VDGSGTISVAELGDSLKAFGIYDSAAELLQSADKNGDGYIDYSEFTFMLREQQAEQGQEVPRSRSRRNLFF